MTFLFVFSQEAALLGTNKESGEGRSGTKIKKLKFPAPLIRSRTVPAIIVPFSVLQAQLAASSEGAPETKVTPPPPPIKSMST